MGNPLRTLCASSLVLVVAMLTATGASVAAGQAPPQAPAQGQGQPQGQPPAQPQGQPAAQQQAQQPTPTFRAGVRLVRVDASVTGSGEKPVIGLKPGDFEVTEDGVPQKVETLQFVRLNGQPKPGDETALDIRSQEHARAEAARDDVRVFVLFLDDYHIDRTPGVTVPMRRNLSAFIEDLQPTDLMAIVDPLTPVSAIEFTRSKEKLLSIIRNFEGRHNEIFPVKNAAEENQLRSGDVARLRAQVTLSALSALCVHLGGLREGRKTVIFVSQGPSILFGSGTIDTDLQDAIESANRGNVTIDVVDPRGLGSYLRAADSLYRLSSETGGRAVLNTNNFEIGLRQVLVDASAYYLIGYSPTRSEDDGKYHKISVKVRRPGVHVLAREGYFAPSRKELTSAAEAANKPQVPGVAGAMQTLARLEPRGAVQAWVGLSRAPEGKTLATVTWEPGATPAPQPVDRVELEIVPPGSKTPTGDPLVVRAAGAGQVPMGSIVLPPGELMLRFTARTVDGAAVDRWEQKLDVPDYAAAPMVLATPRFYVAASLKELRDLQANPNPLPRATRVFHQTDRVFVDIQCYASTAGAEATAELLSAEGKSLLSLPMPELADGKSRVELPIRGLGKGTYLLRVRAHLGANGAEQVIGFKVVP